MSHDTAPRIGDPVPSHVSGSLTSVDSLFDALSHSYRRSVLTYLVRHASSAQVEDVIDYVAADACSATDEPWEDARSRVAVALTHSHLPKLADADLVTFDAEAGVVSATDATAGVEPILDACRDIEDA